MRTSLFRSIFALCALFIVVSTNGFATNDKRGCELQTPYDFTFNVVPIEDCCFNVTITAPEKSVHENHRFKVIINGQTYVAFDDNFTYGHDTTFVICAFQYTDSFDLSIQVICEECLTTCSYNNTFPLSCWEQYEFNEDCCLIYQISPIIGSGWFYYGLLDEYGDFHPQETGTAYEDLPIHPETGLRYIKICPSDGLSELNLRIKRVDLYGNITFINEVIDKTCCNCNLLPTNYPIAIVSVEDPNCTGCAFKLAFTDSRGMPEWAFCNDYIDIDVQSHNDYVTDPETIKHEMYDMSTFNLDEFGVFCLPEGEDYGLCTITFSNDMSPLHPLYIPCAFSFFFDCTGIIYQPEVPTPDIQLPISEPCTPDCPETEWEGPLTGHTTTMSNGNTIDISYEYYWRNACGYQDIQVTDFVYSVFPGNMSFDENFIFAEIIKDIMQKNIIDFKPRTREIPFGEERCDATWRATMGSCFSERYYYYYSTWPYEALLNAVNLDSVTVGAGTSTGFELDSLIASHLELYPLPPNGKLLYKHKCADVDCCTQQMEVCRTNLGATSPITSITNIGSTNSYMECADVYDAYTDYVAQQSYWLQCKPICDWLSEVESFFGSPKIMIDEQHNDLAIAQYSLKDFYANEQIQISFNSTVQANIEVNVYDITGSFIETEKGSFGAGDSQLTINTNNFKTGSYYYIIVINNTLIKSNKFVIVR